MKKLIFPFILTFSFAISSIASDSWLVDSQEEWSNAAKSKENIDIKGGFVNPNAKASSFTSVIKRFDKKRSAKSIVFTQSPIWQNWQPNTQSFRRIWSRLKPHRRRGGQTARDRARPR